MPKFALFFILFVPFYSLGNGDGRVNIDPVENRSLAHLLDYFTIFNEKNFHEQGVRLKIINVPERGECDNTPESCPREELFISVSELEDVGDFNLFSLGKSFWWEFSNWKDVFTNPDHSSNKDHFYFVFDIKKRVMAKNTKIKWFDEITLRVFVNPWNCYVEEISKKLIPVLQKNPF